MTASLQKKASLDSQLHFFFPTLLPVEGLNNSVTKDQGPSSSCTLFKHGHLPSSPRHITTTGEMRVTDEETPLLRDQRTEHDAKERTSDKETPIPWGQFSIALVLQLAEPMSSQVIFPFVPQLVRETGVTGGDDKKIGHFVGIMESVFFVTQALTVLHWSRISDRIGRKPVIYVGLSGLALSMYSFGLARTFPALVIARSLSGALNGNVTVFKSIIGELTDSTNIARAFSYQPIAWSTGATLGPLFGGLFSHPTERFPNVFGGNAFLEKYPYFLPCAIPATFTVLMLIVTLLWLKETNPSGFSFRTQFLRILPGMRSSSGSPSLKAGATPKEPPLRALLTPPVLLSTAVYALLAFVDIAFRALQPVFFATPRSLGGLGIPPHTIGIFLSCFGIANGFFQVGFFARLVKRLGNKRVYLIGITASIPIFALFPVMSAVVHAEDRMKSREDSVPTKLSGVLIFLVLLQLCLALGISMCYGSVYIFITAAAESISLKKKQAADAVRPTRPTLSPSSNPTLVHMQLHRPQESPKIKMLNQKFARRRKLRNKRGLIWEYGRDAGTGEDGGWLPGEGEAGEPAFTFYLNTLFSQPFGVAQEEIAFKGVNAGASVWQKLGGMTVYFVMIALVCFTIAVGMRLPDVPWSAAVDEDDDEDDIAENHPNVDERQ
ncbi:MFS general substrate transporter [Fomitiporia mediterranea MF3/22]|uniref:MFS general substrate transporter n=1 Tax=Fomitiporia mediterranea (strain MF3/22) TaxID=694068 RepID=UPI0004408BCE|nr:MFS general substrate transporter [Fomitiporia mediterranea MF3/22]EJC99920.1 MFS general substrate transporter [Fomitiporia mediterranea MF3/22]